MTIIEILTSMRGQLQNDALDLKLRGILSSLSHRQVLNFKDEDFQSKDIINLFRALKGSHIPISFTFISCYLKGRTITAITTALQTNTVVLTSLDVPGTLHTIQVIALAEALKLNKSLKKLNLEFNKIGINGAKALATALAVNTTLTVLDLHYTGVEGEAVMAIANALKINAALITLNLDNNQIGSSEIVALSEALQVNTALKSLDLGFNDVSLVGAAALGEALKVNVSLTSLNFRFNDIGDEGAVLIAKALEINKTLTSLVLTNNQINTAGASAFAQTFKINNTLRNVNLETNLIGPLGMNTLIQSLAGHASLENLRLGDKTIGDAQIDDLANLICSSDFIESGLVRPKTLVFSGINASPSSFEKLQNAFISHSDRMHQRALALGEALYPNPFSREVATLIGHYDNVTSTPSLLYAFQRKARSVITKTESEIKEDTVKKKI